MATLCEVAAWYTGDERPMRAGTSIYALQQKLDAEGICYYEYIAFLLRDYAEKAFYSNILSSDKVFARFKDIYRPQQKIKADTTAYLDADEFEVNVNDGKTPAEVLDSENLQLSPLFRYLMSVTLGYYGRARKFKQAAEQQVRENPYYFDALEKFTSIFPIKREDLNTEMKQ